MRELTIVTFVLIALTSSTAHAGCYGLPEPGVGERMQAFGKALQGYHPSAPDDLYRRKCVNVKAMIDCGIPANDAVALVTPEIDPYIAVILAQCALPSKYGSPTQMR